MIYPCNLLILGPEVWFCFFIFHVARSVSLSAPLTYFTPHPNPLPSGNHRCVSVLFRFVFLYCRLGSTCKTQTERVFLPDLFHIAKYSAGSPCCASARVLSFFWLSTLHRAARDAFFIRSHVGGRRGCFRVLVVVSSAAVITGVHVSFHTGVFIFFR